MIDPMKYAGDQVFNYIAALHPSWYVVTRTTRFCFDERLVSMPYTGEHVHMHDSTMIIYAGVKFDGASGPAIDGVGNMLAALIHDALCVARDHNAKGLSAAKADRLYRKVCIAQGAGRFRAWTHWTALRAFGWLWRLCR